MSEEERKGLALAEWRALLLQQKPKLKLTAKVKAAEKARAKAAGEG